MNNNKYLEIFKDIVEEYDLAENPEAMELLGFLQAQSTSTCKPAFTEIGLEVLQYMQDGHSKDNKAKDIAVGVNLPPKKVSGAMRKLVTDGYVEKYGANPVIYSLSELGANVDLSQYTKNSE